MRDRASRIVGIAALIGGTFVPCIASAATPDAHVPLRAEEVAVVANATMPDSVDLAKHYLEARHIPEAQLLVTGMTTEESVSRADYEHSIAEPIKSWLMREKLDGVRCIVLMYGVPLRVLEPPADFDEKELEQSVGSERDNQLRQLAELTRRARAIDSKAPAAAPTVDARIGAPPPLEALQASLQEALHAAEGRVLAHAAGKDRDALEAQWLAVWRAAIGFAAPESAGFKLRDAQPTPPERRAGYAKRIRELLARPLTMSSLKEALGLIAESRGAIGSLQSLDGLLDLIKPNWRQRAAVDSELCTLFWPPAPLAGPLTNPFHLFSGLDDQTSRPLMVCRLDGPNPDVVRRMIDDSVAVEKSGLAGKCYLDARGIVGGAYAQYDGDLVRLGRILAKATSVTTVLDQKSELFAAGSCPDAALYCGWYSLGQYVPAFTFARGAVAYHIASSEAATLRKPGAKNWCPQLLAAGAAATIGPVEEPYLTAFPLPSQFFTLLLSGKYPLANCYFLSTRYVSWMMTLIGDPLYCPYAAHPALDMDQLEEINVGN